MRYILTALALLLLLTAPVGCKKHQRPAGMPALDWEARPPCAALMPEPLGRWPVATIDVYLDLAQVYAHDGVTVPECVLPLTAHAVRNAIDAWRADPRTASLKPTLRLVESAAEADVVVMIYFDPYTRKASSTHRTGGRDIEFETWLRSLHAAPVLLSPEQAQAKAASGIAHELPKQGSNYNGVAWVVRQRGVIHSAVCAINGAAAVYYQTTPDPQGNMDQFGLPVSNHEAGHWALGFADDVFNAVASLMCYRAMTPWPTECDRAVSQWLTSWLDAPRSASVTGGDSITRRDAGAPKRGIDCSGE